MADSQVLILLVNSSLIVLRIVLVFVVLIIADFVFNFLTSHKNKLLIQRNRINRLVQAGKVPRSVLSLLN